MKDIPLTELVYVRMNTIVLLELEYHSTILVISSALACILKHRLDMETSLHRNLDTIMAQINIACPILAIIHE